MSCYFAMFCGGKCNFFYSLKSNCVKFVNYIKKKHGIKTVLWLLVVWFGKKNIENVLTNRFLMRLKSTENNV